MKHYVITYEQNGSSGATMTTVDKVKVCMKCKFYKYLSSGQMCTRLDPPVHDVITGKRYSKFSDVFLGVRCQSERFSTEEGHCGIEGRFWKSKYSSKR